MRDGSAVFIFGFLRLPAELRRARSSAVRCNWPVTNKGVLGQKTGGGIFRKAGKEIQVLDLGQKDYRTAEPTASAEVLEILKLKDPVAKFAKLRESQADPYLHAIGVTFQFRQQNFFGLLKIAFLNKFNSFVYHAIRLF